LSFKITGIYQKKYMIFIWSHIGLIG